MNSLTQNYSQMDSLVQIPLAFSTTIVLVKLGATLFLPNDA